MGKVTIGIITRNRSAVLPTALDSALSQTCGGTTVWVWDDASSDETPSLRERYPGVRWSRGEKRLGIPTARARLLQKTGSEYLCNLDDDAWLLEPDALALAVAFLDEKTKVAALGFDVVAPGRETRRPRGGTIPSHTFPGCAHVLRVSAARAVGGFAAFPGFYGCEEKDLAIRLLDAGHEVAILTGVHAWHDKTVVARDMERQHASGVCNDMVFALRRIPWPSCIWRVPGKVVGHLRFAVRFGLVRPCLVGLGRFAAALPEALHSRRPVRRRTWRTFNERMAVGPEPQGDWHGSGSA